MVAPPGQPNFTISQFAVCCADAATVLAAVI
jgi:hypothetical protein